MNFILIGVHKYENKNDITFKFRIMPNGLTIIIKK